MRNTLFVRIASSSRDGGMLLFIAMIIIIINDFSCCASDPCSFVALRYSCKNLYDLFSKCCKWVRGFVHLMTVSGEQSGVHV